MYVVKNSARALMVALIPLAVIHAVLTAMALLGAQATAPADLPPPDRVLVFYVVQIAVDAALLFSGHRMLRRLRVFSRFAYAAMGGVMSAAGYAIAIRNSLQLTSPGDGVPADRRSAADDCRNDLRFPLWPVRGHRGRGAFSKTQL